MVGVTDSIPVAPTTHSHLLAIKRDSQENARRLRAFSVRDQGRSVSERGAAAILGCGLWRKNFHSWRRRDACLKLASRLSRLCSDQRLNAVRSAQTRAVRIATILPAPRAQPHASRSSGAAHRAVLKSI